MKPTTYVDLPTTKLKLAPSTITFDQLQNGDFFTYASKDFKQHLYVMLDKTKQEAGQCLRLRGAAWGPAQCWFDPGSSTGRYVVYKDVKAKNPIFKLT